MTRTLRIPALLLLVAALASGCASGGEDGGHEPAEREGLTAVEDTEEELAAASADEAALPVSDLPGLGPRVVKTASLGLVVERERFERAVERARRLAEGLGGFVVGSHSERLDEEAPLRGTLVLRVPGDAYAEAMTALARLGRVEMRTEETQDVSQEFVDLEARRRHLEAVERQLLALLERARTVQAALAVQSTLNETQLELEQVRGRIRFLENRTELATISLELREPAAEDEEEASWGVLDVWKAGADAFLAVARWVFVALAAASPLVALLVLALLAGRLVRRRRTATSAG